MKQIGKNMKNCSTLPHVLFQNWYFSGVLLTKGKPKGNHDGDGENNVVYN